MVLKDENGGEWYSSNAIGQFSGDSGDQCSGGGDGRCSDTGGKEWWSW